jgi:hypothetical protein
MFILLTIPYLAARPSDKCHVGERLESLVNPLGRSVRRDDDHENDDQAQQQGESVFAGEEFFEYRHDILLLIGQGKPCPYEIPEI